MRKKKPTTPGPTVDQPSINNTRANGLMLGWFAAGWKLRPMIPDYHVDYLLERTEGGELTGKMVYLQQKAPVSGVKFKSGQARERMELKHLRYYAEKVEFPVFLVLVDTETKKAWYLFLQEWIDQNLSKEKLAGTGTTTVSVQEAQPLDDVPAFITAVQRSLAYMREKYPGSVMAAISAEERRIMALDPRFRVQMDVVDGKKTYRLIPKEDVTVTVTVTGESVKLFQEHWETGKPIRAGGGGLLIKGLPAIALHSPQGALAELSIGPATPLEIQWSMWAEEPNGFRLTLDGRMTMGKSRYLFMGQLNGGPLNVELTLPLAGAPDAGRGNVKLSWDYSCWEGNPVGSLSHFDGVYALVRRLVDGERIRHAFHVRGRDIFPGEFTYPKPDDPRAFESFDLIQAARVAATEFKISPNLPKLSTLTVNDVADARMLADLATAGTHSRSEPGMRLKATLTDITDPAEILQRADNPDGVCRFTKPNQVAKLLGLEVELGHLEYTLAPARMLLPPEVRARLEAGDRSGFSAEICGADDATFTVRRILVGGA